MRWNRRVVQWVLLAVAAATMSGCCVLPAGHARGGYGPYGDDGGHHRGGGRWH
jgi:hypothetical protein